MSRIFRGDHACFTEGQYSALLKNQPWEGGEPPGEKPPDGGGSRKEAAVLSESSTPQALGADNVLGTTDLLAVVVQSSSQASPANVSPAATEPVGEVDGTNVSQVCGIPPTDDNMAALDENLLLAQEDGEIKMEVDTAEEARILGGSANVAPEGGQLLSLDHGVFRDAPPAPGAVSDDINNNVSGKDNVNPGPSTSGAKADPAEVMDT